MLVETYFLPDSNVIYHIHAIYSPVAIPLGITLSISFAIADYDFDDFSVVRSDYSSRDGNDFDDEFTQGVVRSDYKSCLHKHQLVNYCNAEGGGGNCGTDSDSYGNTRSD